MIKKQLKIKLLQRMDKESKNVLFTLFALGKHIKY
jgi:hypothetical protein